ncbi:MULTISPECIES: T9SS type A sorting domain-containing protein [unclassified Chryseobacterium]|uniref:T9SS type A sorting domain-containing protein n=1 Tax=unclassified Chryseobacterium TaxID=2593645 RepID=UPI002269861A|nr:MULTISPECIES: T9SS type A sorting domain-containing protein [unclassified Chryseobacterium]
MKKTFLLFLLALSMSFGKLSAQAPGSDYIILLDNGFSINVQTFSEMKLAASKFIESLLSCNPKNRVAVVHYGAGLYGAPNTGFMPRIYIESDFTNDHIAATNFQRRLYFGDQFHEALGLVGDAIDHNPNLSIISPQTTLNLDHHQPLHIITFTDASRNTGTAPINRSYLVNEANTNFNNDGAFVNVTKFKAARDARFVMFHYTPTPNPTAQNAAAVISSPGGTYMGALENFPGDFDGGITPRMYYNRTNGFSLYQTESNLWVETANSICNSTGLGQITSMFYEPNGCGLNGMQAVNWTYSLPVGATLDGFKLEIINNDTGDVYPVDLSNVSQWGTTGQYYNYLYPADFGASSAAGATGQYRLRLNMFYTLNGNTIMVSNYNNYPYFDYDIDLSCVLRSASKAETTPLFKLTPNPTDGLFKVILDKNITSGTLQVMNVSGNVVYNKAFRGEKELEIDIHSQNQGIYIVKVVSDKNEVYTEKLIKK